MNSDGIIYDEIIPVKTAHVICQIDDFGADDKDLTCKLITTLYDMTVMVHDNITGEETEYPLIEGMDKLPENPGSIESQSRGTVKKIDWFNICFNLLFICGVVFAIILIVLLT